ncbi:hypothetical protein [Sphingomonas faeni]|uniref:hypothetical protein n=1 Tax=Sphingomonas faeni TaxID=185950 RepID=UPI003EBB5D78
MSSQLSWRNAVSVHQIRANQCANEPDALLYQIYGGSMQFQLVAATDIAAKIEGSAIADQGAYLIDPGTNRYVVAPLMIMQNCGRSLRQPMLLGSRLILLIRSRPVSKD